MTVLPVIVLRPEPGNAATMARLAAQGIDAIAAPLFGVEPLPWLPPVTTDYDALLLTSANATRMAGGGLAALTALPVWCVGEATAEAARAAGFTVARTGEDGALSLINAGHERLLWLCGEDRTALPLEIEARVTAVTVYRAAPISIDATLFVRPCIALVHSARAARRLTDLARNRALVHVVTISPAVAAAVGDGWASCIATSKPDDTEMVAIAAKLCQKP